MSFSRQSDSRSSPACYSHPDHHLSAIFMERHATHATIAPRDWGGTVLDRLQSHDTTGAHEPIARAEQHGIAQAERHFLATRLSPRRRVAEQELSSLEAL